MWCCSPGFLEGKSKMFYSPGELILDWHLSRWRRWHCYSTTTGTHVFSRLFSYPRAKIHWGGGPDIPTSFSNFIHAYLEEQKINFLIIQKNLCGMSPRKLDDFPQWMNHECMQIILLSSTLSTLVKPKANNRD